MRDVVRIPASDVQLYCIEYNRPLGGDKTGASLRKDAKAKLLKEIADDGNKTIGKVKTSREYLEEFVVVTHWVQAVPMSYFIEKKNLSTYPPFIGNSFVLHDGKEERVITCQCYHQMSTVGPGVLKLDVYRHMNEKEAFEAGWGVGEVYHGGAKVWYCPECMENKACKHVWQIMIKEDKMQLCIPGNKLIRRLIKENAINLYGVVQYTFRMCSKCEIFERIKK